MLCKLFALSTLATGKDLYLKEHPAQLDRLDAKLAVDFPKLNPGSRKVKAGAELWKKEKNEVRLQYDERAKDAHQSRENHHA
jgi:hypothetical protein